MNQDRAGLLFVLAGFSALSVGDAVVKSMAHLWTPTAIGATRYLFAAFALSAILGSRRGPRAIIDMPKAHLQWLRGACVGIATVAMFISVGLMPLAEATTITFMQPMITALLASLFLGERLRLAAIMATLAGFIGVLIVLRPNLSEIGLAALWPLVTAISMATLMITNRAASGAAPPLAMQAYIANTGAILLVAGAVAGHFSGVDWLQVSVPSWSVIGRCAFVAFSASIAHWLIYLGTTRAGAASVAPMAYGQLLSAVLLGWIFFGEVPDALSLVGASIIVGSGLFLWVRGKAPAAAPAT